MAAGHPRAGLRPLTSTARADLRALAKADLPAQEINPGVRDRLSRGALIEIVELPSPYVTHKGRKIAFARITEAGRQALAEKD